MARIERKTGKPSRAAKGKTPKTSRAAAARENPIAREMANRVQDEFEAGYRVDFMGPVVYEKGSTGIGADTVFFHFMIYRSIDKNLKHLPDAPELSELTKEAARDHGAKVFHLGKGKPVKLVDILTTFYEIKDDRCPMTKDGIVPRGPVCEF